MPVTKVFGPQMISGTTPVRSSAKYGELAEDYNQLILFAVVNAAGGANPTLTVKPKDSPDGVNYKEIGTTPPFSAVDISAAPTVLRAVVTDKFGTNVLFDIQLGGTNPTAEVTLYADWKVV